MSYQQRLQHRGLHSPAEINLLGSLGDMIISLSSRVYSEPHKWDLHWGKLLVPEFTPRFKLIGIVWVKATR